MKGQLEISFQWIFVLIAGGTFLFLFIFALRSCTQSGDTRLQTTSVARAASIIGGAVWYPQVNTTVQMPDVTASCPADTITLSTTSANPVRSPLDQVPAFLPSRMKGTLRIVTKDVLVPASPPIRLGSVLYAIDDHTYYFLISDGQNNQNRIVSVLGTGSNIKVTTLANLAAQLATVPATGDSVVVVGFAPWPPQPFPAAGSVAVHWVQFNDTLKKVTFRDRQPDGTLSGGGNDDFVGDFLVTGAVVTGNLPLYRCAKANLVTRIRYLLTIMGGRADALKAQSASCAAHLEDARVILNTLNATTTTDSSMLQGLLTRGPLSMKQQSLYENACPVIG